MSREVDRGFLEDSGVEVSREDPTIWGRGGRAKTEGIMVSNVYSFFVLVKVRGSVLKSIRLTCTKGIYRGAGSGNTTLRHVLGVCVIHKCAMICIVANTKRPGNGESQKGDSVENIIFNFYGLYFGHKHIFCKKRKKATEPQSTAHPPKKPKPKSKISSLWSTIKSLFSKSKKPKVEEKVLTSLQVLIQTSQYNQQTEPQKNFVFEFPGLGESQVEQFLGVYFYPRGFTCKHCAKERGLILLILKRDILAKIAYVSRLTLESVGVLVTSQLGADCYKEIMEGIREEGGNRFVSKNFVGKPVRDESTRANTHMLDAHESEVQKLVKIKGIKNTLNAFGSLQGNSVRGKGGFYDRRASQKNHLRFCEYDFEKNPSPEVRRKEREGGLFYRNTSILNTERRSTGNSFDAGRTLTTQTKRGRHEEAGDSGNNREKLRRMSQRKKSRLSNYLCTETGEANINFLKTPRKDESRQS